VAGGRTLAEGAMVAVLGVPPQNLGTEQAFFKDCFYLLAQVLYRLFPFDRFIHPLKGQTRAMK
jgi:hypothetical protein